MSNENLNSGLMPPVIARETTFGVAPIDFTNSEKGYPINQSYDSPVEVQDNYGKTVVKSTDGRQQQKKKNVQVGNRVVSTSFGHLIGSNDAIVNSSMFFQNGYQFIPTITNGAIVAITNVVDVVTIELTDIGTLVNDEIIVIAGRTDTSENGRYIATNVTASTVDITYVGGFAITLEGAVSAELNKHTAVLEDYTNCEQLLDSSYSIYLPKKFSKPSCSVGAGEIASGMVPQSINYDFLAGSYTTTMIGSSKEDSTNLPITDADYILPINEDGYMRMNSPVVLDADGLVQKAFELTCDITFETEDAQKAYTAGSLDSSIVDGVTVTGSWAMLFKTQDEVNNFSNTIYGNRDKADNSKVISVGIRNTDGTEMFIKGDAVFITEIVNKEAKGWVLRVDYEMLVSDDFDRLELSVVNGYNSTMESLFRS